MQANLVALIRAGALDAELAALLWLLARAGVPIHVAGSKVDHLTPLATALAAVAENADVVTTGAGAALEEVLRQPVPLRPATGAVVIVDDGRVVAAHFHRPPLRDAGGHVRSQAPAVLAIWDPGLGAWEHFAWGVTPELAAAASRKAGDFEIEHARRRDFLGALTTAVPGDADRVSAALAGFNLGTDGV